LNDNEIISNVGLGCESESISQGRSYVDKNLIFQIVSSQDLHHTLEMVVEYMLLLVIAQ